MSIAKKDEERPAGNGAMPAPTPDVEAFTWLVPTFTEAAIEEAAADMAEALATWLPEPLVCMGSWNGMAVCESGCDDPWTEFNMSDEECIEAPMSCMPCGGECNEEWVGGMG
jgi:hypothetical protein